MDTLAEAARLLQKSRVRHILMTCTDAFGVSACDLAEKALRNRGYSATRIESLRTNGLPDEDEADLAIRYLKTNNIKSAIILLPNYKVRRLGRVYRRLGVQEGIEVAIWPQTRDFDPQRWWKLREAKKRVFEELLRLARVL
jgi:hypothetical protein